MTLNEKLLLLYVKLDLACGLNMQGGMDSGWIHVDADGADGMDIVTSWNEIPLQNECIDELHFSDAIEHIRTWEYDKTFGEINRIIKIGGKFWGTTPNRDYIIKAAYEKLQNEEWICRQIYGDGNGYGHTHYTTFTKDKLKDTLEKYGFGEVYFHPIEEWIRWDCIKIKNL